MSAVSHKVALAFWSAVPAIVTFTLLILYLVPKHSGAFSYVIPPLYMTSIYYWGMTNYRHMPLWFVFMLGILADTVTGVPLGVTSLACLLFLVVMRSQHKYIYKEGFLIQWAFFSALLMVVFGVQWILVTSLGNAGHALFPLVIQWVLTVCCYPILSRAFDILQAVIASRRLTLLHTK